jgi:pantetheine-phosphate adenylyltransferase
LYCYLSQGGLGVTIAIYPGSFDPITNGHLDIAVRASRLFEKLIIGVYNNPSEKVLLFTTQERVELAREAVCNVPNIEVTSYTELTGDFARKMNAKVMVRGLRMGGDFEREFTLSMMNRKLFPDLEQLCLMASVEYQFVSSSLLKEAASLGGNTNGLVPENVALALKKKFGRIG